MKPRNHLKLLPLLFALLITSCVSVKIKTESPTKSNEYSFVKPQGHFTKLGDDQTDHAWQNEQTGNTIAVLSECSESRDPSLTALESETIHALNNYKILKSQEFNFQARAARRSLVEGTVDGIAVKMDVLTFKKNSCAYTITYMGRASGFASEQEEFESFLKGFVVP